MGYTHYWRQPSTPYTAGEFTMLDKMVTKIVETAALPPYEIGIDRDCSVRNAISLNGANLDGTENDELSHEDFVLDRGCPGFAFCKTAQKPYDAVVVACLIAAESLAKRFGTSMRLSSDGDCHDWQTGAQLFESCFPGWLAVSEVMVGDMRLVLDAVSPIAVDREDKFRVWWIDADASDETFYYPIDSIADGEKILAAFVACEIWRWGKRRYATCGIQQLTGKVSPTELDEDELDAGWETIRSY